MTDATDVRRPDRLRPGPGPTDPTVHAGSGPTALIIESDEMVEATTRLAGALDDTGAALPAGA